jgi:hypothetical protein
MTGRRTPWWAVGLFVVACNHSKPWDGNVDASGGVAGELPGHFRWERDGADALEGARINRPPGLSKGDRTE